MSWSLVSGTSCCCVSDVAGSDEIPPVAERCAWVCSGEGEGDGGTLLCAEASKLLRFGAGDVCHGDAPSG